MKKIVLVIFTALMLVCLAVSVTACDMGTGENSSSQSSEPQSQSQSSVDDSSSSALETTTLVYSVSQKSSFAQFVANTGVKENKQTEFFNRTQSYKVGDDNAFDFKPEVTFMLRDSLGTMTPITPEKWTYGVKLYEKTGETTYVLLETADVTSYTDAIDVEKCTVDFSAGAIGKTFKIEVCPDGLTENQLKNVETYTKSVEVEVIDGFNAYTALDIAYVNGDRLDGDEKTAWINFMTAKGLDVNYVPTAVIMQADIYLTKNDVPDYYFFNETEVAKTDIDYAKALGSLKDYVDIYRREVKADQGFTFEGNYFTFNVASFPMVVRADNEIQPLDTAYESHTQVFKFNNTGNDVTTGMSTIQNVNFVGNAPRVEDTTKSGGLILVKAQSAKFTAYNNIATGWFITYFPEYSKEIYNMNYCKSYDCFACIVYNYGSDQVFVDNCEFIGAGGPVFIMDHVHYNEENEHISGVTVTNSNLHSYVTGSEGWFNMYGMTAAVAGIKQMNTAFTPFGRSFIKSKTVNEQNLEFIDLIAVFKDSSAKGFSSNKISGRLSMNNAALALNFGTYPTDPEPYLATFIDTVYTASSGASPVFATSTGNMGYAYMGQAGLTDMNNAQIMDPNHGVFKGDYLYMYYQRMGICLGYFGVGETL